MAKLFILILILVCALSRAEEDCQGLGDKIQKKIEDKIIGAADDYAKKNGVPGLVKPLGGFARDLAHAKNDQQQWDAAVDYYFDGPLDKIPGLLKNGWRKRIKDAFGEFNGMGGGGGVTAGGCGGKPADDAAEGSGGAGRRIDPLVLDLTGQGVRFVDRSRSRAYFDLTGNGFATRTAWIEPNAGFLAVDRNHDGVVNDITELFGSATRDGFSELRRHDSNHDGKIDAAEGEKAALLIWVDGNGDGVSQSDELLPFARFGVTEISLNAKPEKIADDDGRILSRSTFVLRGFRGGIYDVDFFTLPAYSRVAGSASHGRVAEDDGESLNVRGYGTLPDLAIAMAKRPALRDFAQALIAEKSLADFERFLYAWAEIGDDIQGDVEFPRAKVVIAKKRLAFLAKYAGVEKLATGDGAWREPGGTKHTGKLYARAWEAAYRNLLAKFAVRAGLVDKSVRYRVDSDYLYTTRRLGDRAEDPLTQLALSEISGPAARLYSADAARRGGDVPGTYLLAQTRTIEGSCRPYEIEQVALLGGAAPSFEGNDFKVEGPGATLVFKDCLKEPNDPGRLQFARPDGTTVSYDEFVAGMAPVFVNASGKLLKDAVNEKHDRKIEMLLRGKIDVNWRDEDGNTALHLAARRGEFDRVARLAATSGIFLETKNRRGETAFDVAAKREKEALAFLGGGRDPILVGTARVSVGLHNWLESLTRR